MILYFFSQKDFPENSKSFLENSSQPTCHWKSGGDHVRAWLAWEQQWNQYLLHPPSVEFNNVDEFSYTHQIGFGILWCKFLSIFCDVVFSHVSMLLHWTLDASASIATWLWSCWRWWGRWFWGWLWFLFLSFLGFYFDFFSQDQNAGQQGGFPEGACCLVSR